MNAQNFMDLLEGVDQDSPICISSGFRGGKTNKISFALIRESIANMADRRSKSLYEALEKIEKNLPIITTSWGEQRKNSTITVREAIKILRNS